MLFKHSESKAETLASTEQWFEKHSKELSSLEIAEQLQNNYQIIASDRKTAPEAAKSPHDGIMGSQNWGNNSWDKSKAKNERATGNLEDALKSLPTQTVN